jgi:hypothetical protein
VHAAVHLHYDGRQRRAELEHSRRLVDRGSCRSVTDAALARGVRLSRARPPAARWGSGQERLRQVTDNSRPHDCCFSQSVESTNDYHPHLAAQAAARKLARRRSRARASTAPSNRLGGGGRARSRRRARDRRSAAD